MDPTPTLPEPPAAPSFRRLAQRVAAWTTRFLLSAIILVAGIGFGRQVLQWWADDRSTPPLAPVAGDWGALGDAGGLQRIEFGDRPWSVWRRETVVSEEALETAMRELCEAALQTAAPPAAPPSAAEQRLLKRLAASEPAARLDHGYRLYRLRDPVQMAVVVGEPTRPQLAAGGARVLTWGLGLRAGNKRWTLYAFGPSAGAAASGGAAAGAAVAGGQSHEGAAAIAGEIALPPDAARTIAIGTQGGALLAFAGAGDADAWRRWFDTWAAQAGWQADGAWQARGERWLTRYRREREGVRQALEIQFGSDARGGLTGMAVESRAASVKP